MTNAELEGQLNEVNFLAEKVARVHGDHEPKLLQLHAAVIALTAQLTGGEPASAEAVERVRSAADGFRTPEWACNSYRRLFARLQALTESLAV